MKLAIAIAATAAGGAALYAAIALVHRRRQCAAAGDGILGAIGNTPLIRIRSLSEATGCEIYGKAEFLNPGGSVKDRVAAQIIKEALQDGKLRTGGMVTEGSAGSTAISLAMVAAAYGCKCHVVIPDDAAIEKSCSWFQEFDNTKQWENSPMSPLLCSFASVGTIFCNEVAFSLQAQLLEALGATVERVRPVSITHKDHYVNIARRRALEAEVKYKQQISGAVDENPGTGYVLEKGDSAPAQVKSEQAKNCLLSTESPEQELTARRTHECQGGYFADQFENLANFRAHYEGTGPEIWRQTGGNIDAFIAASGTGGTIAGISCYLKDQKPNVKCYLIDPPGSGLFNRVSRGVMYTREEAEGKRLKNPFDTITEGIGINRLTKNFMQAKLDGAFRGSDKEAAEMSRFLLKKDGIFIGSSSAINCVGAVRVAQLLGPGHTVVTILCDSGARHLSKFYNVDYLSTQGLLPTAKGLEFLL